MKNKSTRRQFIKGALAAGTAGLAGCDTLDGEETETEGTTTASSTATDRTEYTREGSDTQECQDLGKLERGDSTTYMVGGEEITVEYQNDGGLSVNGRKGDINEFMEEDGNIRGTDLYIDGIEGPYLEISQGEDC